MPDKKTILVVDDTPANIAVLVGALGGDYNTKVATTGRRALELVAAGRPDLILLDIMMPEMDGYEVCRRLKADPASADIPVIFVSAKTEVEDETQGLALGAVDYIHKPFSPPIVKARLKSHLALATAQESLKRQNETLEEKVQSRTREISLIQDVTIVAMASLAETRDNETGNHIRRTQNYVKVLARRLAPRQGEGRDGPVAGLGAVTARGEQADGVVAAVDGVEVAGAVQGQAGDIAELGRRGGIGVSRAVSIAGYAGTRQVVHRPGLGAA